MRITSAGAPWSADGGHGRRVVGHDAGGGRGLRLHFTDDALGRRRVRTGDRGGLRLHGGFLSGVAWLMEGANGG